MAEFWAMPVGMFYDLIACKEILHGAEEAPVEAEKGKGKNQPAGNHDYSLMKLK